MAVISLPLYEVSQVRDAFPDVTVNDIILALVAGALRDYLAAHDELPSSPVRTTCPGNIRANELPTGQGNSFTTMWVDLPVHLTDPAGRLDTVSASARAAKHSLRESQASWDALADVGDLLLPGVVTAVMALAGTRMFSLFPPTQNLTTSTVNSSRKPLYLATRKITHMYARTIVCPPIHLFVNSVTYAGQIDFSITTVEALCPDPEALANGLRAELDRLLAVAHSHPSRRRRARRPAAAAQ